MPLSQPLARALDAGWAGLRAGRMAGADSAFREVLSQCPREPGAQAGRGYVAMRQGELVQARAFFSGSLAALPGGYDALTGLGMATFRQGDMQASRDAFARAARLFPSDTMIRSYLARMPESYEGVTLPTRRRLASLRVDARVGRRIFEIPAGAGRWQGMWVKGVNIGAALPGKHPSEFPPDDGTYEGWLQLAADMAANTLRVYTIHPPHFYRALEKWNTAHPSSPLWLIHGVWTELPPGELEERYDDEKWRSEFRTEGRRVVDLLHGHAVIPPKPGHAAGVYTADVSRWVLAYITGREWEPYSVEAYSALHPERTAYQGRYLRISGGSATEVWQTEECDALLAYEVERYNALRPIAYTNWPTLDPLVHPTESTVKEEARLRPWSLPETPKEFDNDAIGLDAMKMRATARNPAGTFASYHAYPYYPDFLVLDPGYGAARTGEGPSHYYGYLKELVTHHGTMPVLISEYGVPSSRGNAHFQPQGWNHGGHSEAEQAAINARLTRDIHAAGAAGAMLFAVIDEWFKKNWVVIDFEQPLERNRLWLNPLDAEQNYGVIAMRAGARDSAMAIDGKSAEWNDRGRHWPIPTAADGVPPALEVRDFRVRSDEAYVYVRLDVGALDWAQGRYLIGIDSYRADRGGHTLPYTGTACAAGMEFVLDLGGPDRGYLLVDRPYNLYKTVALPGSKPPQTMQVYNRPWESIDHLDPRWDTLRVETNRSRVGRDGTVFPAISYERNRLTFGKQAETTLADWYADPATGVIEVRLAWGMLQVLDPSSRLVLQGMDKASGSPAGETTDGFRFVVQSYAPGAPGTPGALLGCAAPLSWSWATWETPTWHAEVKPLFRAMREVFRELRPPR